MRVPRNALVAASAAAALLAGGTPAAANTAATIDGALWIGCYGCGTYGPTGNAASLLVTGAYAGTITTGSPATVPFTVNSALGAGCGISSTASGSINVGGDVRTLVWTVVGAYASITIWKSGAAPIEGQAAFVLSDPVRPCGRAVAVRLLGTLYGA